LGTLLRRATLLMMLIWFVWLILCFFELIDCRSQEHTSQPFPSPFSKCYKSRDIQVEQLNLFSYTLFSRWKSD
jgi:hypothetical protein